MLDEFLNGDIGMLIKESKWEDVAILSEILRDKQIVSYDNCELYSFWKYHIAENLSAKYIFYDRIHHWLDGATSLHYINGTQLLTAKEILAGNDRKFVFEENEIEFLLKGE